MASDQAPGSLYKEKIMSYINLNSLTFHATEKLLELDRSFIGTEHYMGYAYFWNYEYRHYLRDATISSTRKVHHALLKAGLAVDGESEEHYKIICKYTKLR